MGGRACGPDRVNKQHSSSRLRGGQASGRGQGTWPGLQACPCTAQSCLHPPGACGSCPCPAPSRVRAGSPAHCWLHRKKGRLLGALGGLLEPGPSEPPFPHLQHGWPVHVRSGGAGRADGLRELGGRHLPHGMHSSRRPAVPKHQEAASGAELYCSDRILSCRAVEPPRPGSHP